MPSIKTEQKWRGTFRCYWYEYPAGQGAGGSGGWSRNAKHRPAPVLVCHLSRDVRASGKSMLIGLPTGEVRKLKCTIIRDSTGEVLREDYPASRIKEELFTRTVGDVALHPASAGDAPAEGAGRVIPPMNAPRRFAV